MNTLDILTLAARHNLHLKDEMTFNEMGIDFKVVFASAKDNTSWVLRIPRRGNMGGRILEESKILALVNNYLSVAVPNWKIANPELIAYPLLQHKPVLTYDSKTYEVTWYMDKRSPKFVSSLAKVLLELHSIPILEAEEMGIKILSPEMARQEIHDRIEFVKSEVGIGTELENRWRKWLDNDQLWPDFSTFVHGDLYAGHILASETGEISGIIDWSEGQVSDPTMDFSGHISVFGKESLNELISEYEKLGGKVWENMFEQTIERHSASALNYAFFAINTQSEEHLQAAKMQLGLI
jgi:macrolide phosphotransferase